VESQQLSSSGPMLAEGSPLDASVLIALSRLVLKVELNGRENLKGCDIGYAPAAGSCEGVNNVDTCTVTAPDAITAFAVPNPGCTSQCPPVFSGLVTLWIAPPG